MADGDATQAGPQKTKLRFRGSESWRPRGLVIESNRDRLGKFLTATAHFPRQITQARPFNDNLRYGAMFGTPKRADAFVNRRPNAPKD